MEEPRLVYQKSSDYPGKVAVLAQFLPTFTSKLDQALIVTTSGLDEEDLPKELDNIY